MPLDERNMIPAERPSPTREMIANVSWLANQPKTPAPVQVIPEPLVAALQELVSVSQLSTVSPEMGEAIGKITALMHRPGDPSAFDARPQSATVINDMELHLKALAEKKASMLSPEVLRNESRYDEIQRAREEDIHQAFAEGKAQAAHEFSFIPVWRIALDRFWLWVDTAYEKYFIKPVDNTK